MTTEQFLRLRVALANWQWQFDHCLAAINSPWYDSDYAFYGLDEALRWLDAMRETIERIEAVL